MKALLVVDVQNDFLPGGALAVKEGDQVVPIINQLVKKDFDVIVASKDWHPKGHGSFASTHGKQPGEHVKLMELDQILWPDHCVQGSEGAEFSPALDASHFDKVFFKGTDPNYDSYSAFFDNGHHNSTGLDRYLKDIGVTDVYIVGIATDYCVKYTVLDASREGFKSHVIIDACRAVNLNEGDEQKAIEEMKQVGANILIAKDFFGHSSED